MFGWLRPVAAGASIAVVLATGGCADRRRSNDDMVRAAVAAPAPAPHPPAPRTPPPAAKECGQPGAPECPLQAWMDNRLNASLSTGDYREVARAFRELAAEAPESFASWGTWSEKGALAAERQDDAGIRKSCSGCHDEHREAYRRTMRDHQLRASAGPSAATETP
jgi:hypothetical protein